MGSHYVKSPAPRPADASSAHVPPASRRCRSGARSPPRGSRTTPRPRARPAQGGLAPGRNKWSAAVQPTASNTACFCVFVGRVLVGPFESEGGEAGSE